MARNRPRCRHGLRLAGRSMRLGVAVLSVVGCSVSSSVLQRHDRLSLSSQDHTNPLRARSDSCCWSDGWSSERGCRFYNSPFAKERLPPTFDLGLIEIVYVNLLLDVKIEGEQALKFFQIMFDEGTRIQRQLDRWRRPASSFLAMVAITSRTLR